MELELKKVLTPTSVLRRSEKQSDVGFRPEAVIGN